LETNSAASDNAHAIRIWFEGLNSSCIGATLLWDKKVFNRDVGVKGFRGAKGAGPVMPIVVNDISPDLTLAIIVSRIYPRRHLAE
jgi:hypothetical protein